MAETTDAITSPIRSSSAPPPRDPITCHVLDLTTGVPAPHLSVSLTLIKPFGPSAPMTGLTNGDGRVTNWSSAEGPSLTEIFENMTAHDGGKMIWSLKFDTGSYYGEDKTFFPEVEVRFRVEATIQHIAAVESGVSVGMAIAEYKEDLEDSDNISIEWDETSTILSAPSL